jgi:hypothetical protein
MAKKQKVRFKIEDTDDAIYHGFTYLIKVFDVNRDDVEEIEYVEPFEKFTDAKAYLISDLKRCIYGFQKAIESKDWWEANYEVYGLLDIYDKNEFKRLLSYAKDHLRIARKFTKGYVMQRDCKEIA